MENQLYKKVMESLEVKGFNPLSCIKEIKNGFEITEDIGFGHSYSVGYVNKNYVSLTYKDIDDQDNSVFYGVISNQTALDVINKCLDDIVRDS